jgi:hypothetical protein
MPGIHDREIPPVFMDRRDERGDDDLRAIRLQRCLS